ncbi:MAG: hypothetical protein QY309_13215 [Cyclobacteriaceae bacterium]|nr:MAG: hypothetical protein QY309_13215 [Cyclobacteriaceae bacterium]
MKYGILALFALTVLSCTDDKTEIIDIKDLRGSWVEIKNTTDTMSFETLFNDTEFIILKRAELYRTGPYEYSILPDNKISIRWSLASTMTFNEYYFKVTGDKLNIGNFYDSPSGEILTFKKID